MSGNAAATVKTRADLARLTGAGVSVGIIDSGYSASRAKVRLGGGVRLSGGSGEAVDAGWDDQIGHGTACAGIIARKAPEVAIYPIKIFEDELVSDMGKLVEGIRWGCEQGLQVLNLSLGTTDLAAAEEMREACREATERGTMVVAATANDGRESVPASLPGVFGVAAGKVRGKHDLYFDAQESIQLVARGDRQRLDWVEGQQVFLGGSSFAAPHATAIIALLLQQYPGVSFEEMCQLLGELSVQERPEAVVAEGESPEWLVGAEPTRPTARLADLHSQTDLGWMGRALVYPYNKEMHSLVRGKDLLCFELARVVDVVGGRNIGKDSGEAIGAQPSGVPVAKDLEGCLEDVDTVVLGYLDQISRIKKRDHLREVLDLALEHGKNVYSLSPIGATEYPEVANRFEERGLHLSCPTVTGEDYERITGAFDWRYESRKPVVGVFGTSPSQGKFTAQLALRAELQRIGYKVGQVGTEHQSALFGFDFTFPNGYDGRRSVQIPLDAHVPLLQSVMAGIEQEEPHLTIVGTQSGLIPYSFAQKTPGYTLSTIAVLFGTLPDAYVLAVNSIDEEEFIEQTMATLKALGKGETIALVFSDKKKEEGSRLGRSWVTTQQMTAAEMEATAARLEKRFGLPAVEVVSEVGRRKLAAAVEDFFDADRDGQGHLAQHERAARKTEG